MSAISKNWFSNNFDSFGGDKKLALMDMAQIREAGIDFPDSIPRRLE